MRRFFPVPVVYFLFILLFPAVRWARRPDDALTRCPPTRWRIDDDGALRCDRGRPLRPLERLSLGLPVDVHDLTREDWRALVGRTLAGRLEARRARQGFLCRRQLGELADELADEVLERLPPGLTCGR
jgi:hypothetical protein